MEICSTVRMENPERKCVPRYFDAPFLTIHFSFYFPNAKKISLGYYFPKLVIVSIDIFAISFQRFTTEIRRVYFIPFSFLTSGAASLPLFPQ